MAKLKPFTMPKWGIEMSEGTIAEWMVAENEAFAKGAVLTLIETDKITNEVEAEAPGSFVRIIAEAGQTYPVGALLAVLSDGGAASAAEIDAVDRRLQGGRHQLRARRRGRRRRQPPPPAPPPAAPQRHPRRSRDQPGGARAARSPPASMSRRSPARAAAAGSPRRTSIRRRAPPPRPPSSARSPQRPPPPPTPRRWRERLSVLHGVALDGLAGSGPRGRIRKADVLAAAAQARAAPRRSPLRRQRPPPPPRPHRPRRPPPASGVDVMPMSSMRRTIARRLTEAKSTIPHFYVRRRVRADRLLALRAAVQGQRPSVNDYLIKACALALMEVPQVNIQVHGNEIHRFGSADIAVAVATEKGLVTPIVTAADDRSVADISTAMAALAQRAQVGQAPPRGVQRRQLLAVEPRRLRRRAVRCDHQPAAGRDPRGRHRPARADRRCRRDPHRAGLPSVAVVRPSRHRRRRWRPLHGGARQPDRDSPSCSSGRPRGGFSVDFKLTPDQEELRSVAREFARAELPAIAAELERDNKPPSHDLIKRYAEMGFLGINVSTESRRPRPRQYRGADRARGVRQDLVGGRLPDLRILGRPGPRDRAFRARGAAQADRARRSARGEMVVAVVDVRARRRQRADRPQDQGRGRRATRSSSTAPSAGARAAAMPTPMSSIAACPTRPAPRRSARCWWRRTRPASASARPSS